MVHGRDVQGNRCNNFVSLTGSQNGLKLLLHLQEYEQINSAILTGVKVGQLSYYSLKVCFVII